MHISLDSALGRQKRLNSVGESVLQIAPDAAAAYSLRSLTGGDPDVVRVRRESDNTEKNFSGSQIESGEMARWVNEQPTLPLDLRELDTNTGERDGALIEAAAAYSLRKLKEDFTGDVVEVRRNVDGETEGFTAAEVTDGTMEKWVEGWSEFNELIDNSQFERDGLTIVDYQDARNFRIQANGINGFDWNLFYNNVGKHRVTFNLTLNEGQASDLSTLRLVARDGYDPDNVFTSNSASLSEGYNDIEINNIDNLVPSLPKLMFQKSYSVEGNFDVTISNLKVYKSVVNELPLDQATGAAAAYSLRNLSSSYTGNVVEVRRSSDDAVKSFTASEVADGTLENWVNTDVVTYESDFSAGTGGWFATNATRAIATDPTGTEDVLKVTVDASTSPKWGYINNQLTAGHSYSVQAEVYVPSSNESVDSIVLMDGSGGMATSYLGIQTDEWVTVSTTGTPISGSFNVRAADGTTQTAYTGFQGNGTDVFYIRNVQITQTTADGHVRTWYDQSGSDNHAVQTDTASQPKIVEGGTLLKDGNNVPQVRFDGTDDYLEKLSFSLSQAFTIFSLSDTEEQGKENMIVAISNSYVSGVRPLSEFYRSDNGFAINAGTTLTTAPSFTYSTNTSYLKTSLFNGSSSEIFVDGASKVTGDAGSNNPSGNLYIGGISNPTPAGGAIQEIIIYNSDQSTKRRAIEENIANHYDISLAAFSRDGTVKTWYDQTESRTDDPQNITGFLVERSNDIMNGEWDKVADVNGKVAFTHADDVNRTLNWNGTRWEFKDSSTVYYYSTVDTTYPFDVSNEWVAVEGSGTPDFESFDGGWYDPLGRGGMLTMHADVFQPTIVRNGTYLGEIDFDESNDKLNAHFELDIDPADSGFASIVVARVDSTDTTRKQVLLQNSPSGSRHLIQWQPNGRYQFYARDAEGDTRTFITNDSFGNDEYKVFTTTIDSNSLCRANVNGFGEVNNLMNESVDFSSVDSTANSDEVISPSGNPFMGAVKEMIFYLSDQSDNRTAIEANIGETYGITEIPAANDTVNGFVQTWYDQSGNVPANDAEQSAASSQPKIVVNGTYLGEIKFENGLYVQKTGLSLSGPFSTFSLSNANSQHNGALLNFGTSFSQQYRSNLSLLLQYGDTNFSSAGAYTVGEQNVMSFIFDTTGLGYYNGTEVINDATTGATATQFRVGNSPFGLDGDVKEIIIYNSNQSANRPAIETNIANQYGITLS